MGQSKKYSWFETITNISVGFLVALGAQNLIFPFFGIFLDLAGNIKIAAFFTVIGVLRMYVMRRFFNWLHTKGLN